MNFKQHFDKCDKLHDKAAKAGINSKAAERYTAACDALIAKKEAAGLPGYATRAQCQARENELLINALQFFHLTKKSSNAKTGKIPVSTTSDNTCPPSCPLLKSACYASSGYHLRMHWQKVSSGARGGTLAEFCRQIEALPAGQVWRHNQAGDLPGLGDAIDAGQLSQIVAANTGRRGFTYTHKPITGKHGAGNLEAIRAANNAGFTVNLSANNLEHADTLSEHGAPVVTLLDENAPRKIKTPAGRTVITCPAQVRENVTCATCGAGRPLCGRADRSFIVGFLAHGTGKKAAADIARGAAA